MADTFVWVEMDMADIARQIEMALKAGKIGPDPVFSVRLYDGPRRQSFSGISISGKTVSTAEARREQLKTWISPFIRPDPIYQDALATATLTIGDRQYKVIVADLNAKLNELSTREYKRMVMSEWYDPGKNEIVNELYAYTNDGLPESVVESERIWKNLAAQRYIERYAEYLFSDSDMPKNAPDLLRAECEGEMPCECDDPNCLRLLGLTYEEYIDASGPGNFRVCHPDCFHGVDGLTMVRHEAKFNVYAPR